MTYQQITYAVDDGVAIVTLNRPEKLNAWTPIMGGELLDAFRTADRDAGVRAVLFTGSGERAFCAGADMGFFAEQIAAGGGTGSSGGSGGGPSRVEEFPQLMRKLSKPTIAVLNGYALGIELKPSGLGAVNPTGRTQFRVSFPQVGSSAGADPPTSTAATASTPASGVFGRVVHQAEIIFRQD